MRMRFPFAWTRRLRVIQEERGAVAAIVVISMIGLLGMLVITVDLGGMLTMRRRMVAGTDAAALAAAESCARQLPGEAQQQSDTFAADNEPGSTRISYSANGCSALASSGTVNVSYKAPVQLQFAPVLGFPSQTSVSAAATAEWGPAGSAGQGQGVPLAVNAGTSQTDFCNVPNIAIGTQCHVWFDNDRVGSASWSWLNLNQWGVSSNTHCTPDPQDLRHYIQIGGYDGPNPLALNYPNPTYVCADHGLRSSDFSMLDAWDGQILLFPMADPSTQVPPGGGSKVDKFNVVGFVAMRLDHVYKANQVGDTSGSCSTSWTVSSSQPSIDLDTQSCLGGVTVDEIDNLTLTDSKNKKTTYVLNTNYTYDSSTHIVTWKGTPPANPVNVAFDWVQYGPCGASPGNASARCLLVTWEGVQLSGGNPGGGQDFGVRAIRLSN